MSAVGIDGANVSSGVISDRARRLAERCPLGRANAVFVRLAVDRCRIDESGLIRGARLNREFLLTGAAENLPDDPGAARLGSPGEPDALRIGRGLESAGLASAGTTFSSTLFEKSERRLPELLRTVTTIFCPAQRSAGIS